MRGYNTKWDHDVSSGKNDDTLQMFKAGLKKKVGSIKQRKNMQGLKKWGTGEHECEGWRQTSRGSLEQLLSGESPVGQRVDGIHHEV